MADLKKQVDDIKNDLGSIRSRTCATTLNAIGKDLQSSFDAEPAPEAKPEAAVTAPEPATAEPATPEPVASEPAASSRHPSNRHPPNR